MPRLPVPGASISSNFCEQSRLVCVVSSFSPSLVNFRGPLLQAMVGEGHRVIALGPASAPRVTSCLQSWGVRHVVFPLQRTGMSPLADLRTLFALRRIFLAERPDVVLSYTIKPVIYGSLAARQAGVRAVFSMITGAGYAFLGETWKQKCVGRGARLLYRAAMGASSRVFFQNPDDLSLFENLGLLQDSSKAVLVSGSGVDLAHFSVMPPPQGGPLFLLVARLYREKGIFEFVEAAKIVRQRNSNCRFRIVGGIDANPSAVRPEVLASWQRDRLVELVDWVDDVRPHLAASTVYVLPSYREGTPRSVLEAMATGRPIITTNAPGCRQTVIHGENGFLVPVKDAVALAKAMEVFILHPELVARMGARSRQLAEERFDVHKVNQVMLASMSLLRRGDPVECEAGR